ncbi:UNVERIFIED_CONTAM: putative calcium-binding protein CML41 [Sesamum radiatum]|uniref:Calcium-binding protein CML41 n=1 Tax=Sesamum radiatum TaxID=300843 RepID=A0AAW2M5N7_SESRA
MAIAGIARSFAGRAFKLRLPFRRRSKPRTEDPSHETTAHCGGGLKSSKEEEFRQVFRYFDANNDGKISAEELSAYFASTGDSVSLEEAEKIIREFSNDGAGESLLLEFGEFVRMMELRDAEDDKVLRQAFEVYVVEKDGGCITPEGLRQVLRRLGDVKSHQECEAMIRVFDLDGNGVLDFHEFHKMMT